MIVKMNLLLRVLFINNREIFKYLDYDDHKNLSLAFMDNYIIFLLDRINYRKNAGRDHYFEYDFNLKKRVKKVVDYDFIVKMVLESININRLKSKTLNLLHRGFWNHISLNCKLKEKFVYKWSHKINMMRFKLNKNCRGFGADNGVMFPRPFSNKFKARFPGIEMCKPCFRCFEDTANLFRPIFFDSEWMCEDCYNNESSFEYDDSDYLPSDRHWSEDDTDYEDWGDEE
jgi:hypothetical protein